MRVSIANSTDYCFNRDHGRAECVTRSMQFLRYRQPTGASQTSECTLRCAYSAVANIGDRGGLEK